VLELTRPHIPTARGGFEHQAIRGIAGELKPIEGIEDEQNAHVTMVAQALY
jgi:hypothetical protein